MRKEKISLEMAESSLKDLLEPRKINVGISDIKAAVAHYYKLRVSALISKRRTRNISFPRHVAMFLCRKHTTASYPQIGMSFGGRDHSSVVHSANVVRKKLTEDGNVVDDIKKIEDLMFKI